MKKVFYQRIERLPQRRPSGHAVGKHGTKRGNKKRGLRARVLSLLDEEGASDEEDEEDDDGSGSGVSSCADVAHFTGKGS